MRRLMKIPLLLVFAPVLTIDAYRLSIERLSRPLVIEVQVK
jgi:hypothetical protein